MGTLRCEPADAYGEAVDARLTLTSFMLYLTLSLNLCYREHHLRVSLAALKLSSR